MQSFEFIYTYIYIFIYTCIHIYAVCINTQTLPPPSFLPTIEDNIIQNPQQSCFCRTYNNARQKSENNSLPPVSAADGLINLLPSHHTLPISEILFCVKTCGPACSRCSDDFHAKEDRVKSLPVNAELQLWRHFTAQPSTGWLSDRAIRC